MFKSSASRDRVHLIGGVALNLVRFIVIAGVEGWREDPIIKGEGEFCPYFLPKISNFTTFSPVLLFGRRPHTRIFCPN